MASLITDLEGLSTVTGIHGGKGVTKWKGVGGTSMMEGDWDAIEYCALCGNATAGVHTHALTEELWFVLSGRNRATLGHQTVELSAGDLVLTGVGGSHGSEQLGDEEMTMVVIAVRRSSPRMWNAAPGTWTGRYHVTNLDRDGSADQSLFVLQGQGRTAEVGPSDLRRVMGAPWRTMAAVNLEQGASLAPRDLTESEIFLFVRSGEGALAIDGSDVPIKAGSSITFGAGSRLDLRQTGADPLSIFAVELGVLGRGDA